ncbi:DOMON-like domain-containing protein [Hydrogenophaga sp. RWCD_12]|uniref:DOMON-like domain-containing protein n=1 Tax=Hydrogenophaga sp. RWCD_12 TaxID=3391190 RepID=UPI0039846678
MPDSRLVAAPASLLALQVHPATPGPEGLSVRAGVQIVDDAVTPGWWLHYLIEGPVDALTIPVPQTPGPADGLWRHTCFEAFVQDGDGPGYREFNFSPSGQWAVYRFTAERERCANDTPPAVGPSINVQTSADALHLRAWIPHALLPETPGRVGLTAVIETTEGQLSYWALQHPHDDRPDFHHPAGRALAPA